MKATKTITLDSPSNDGRGCSTVFRFDGTDVVLIEDWADGECQRSDDISLDDAGAWMAQMVRGGWTVYVRRAD